VTDAGQGFLGWWGSGYSYS